MKTYKIVGGPELPGVRLINPDTGEMVPGVTKIQIVIDASDHRRLVTARIEMIVSLDLDIRADATELVEVTA